MFGRIKCVLAVPRYVDLAWWAAILPWAYYPARGQRIYDQYSVPVLKGSLGPHVSQIWPPQVGRITRPGKGPGPSGLNILLALAKPNGCGAAGNVRSAPSAGAICGLRVCGKGCA